MGLFRRKPTEEPAPEPEPRVFPIPPPPPRADGLRDFDEQRDYVLDLLNPLTPFGVSLLDAVGLTLNESIKAEQAWPASSIKAGDILVRKGTRIHPRLVGLVAAIGIDKVITRPRPRVAVIPVGRPSQALAGARDLASYLVAAELQTLGAQVWHVPGSAYDEAELAELIGDQMIRADLIVTTGGFESGEVDVVAVLSEIGLADTTPVAITPGRQQGFALVGDDAVPLLALPSDPVAAHVLLVTLVDPVARKLIGADTIRPTLERARVAQPVSVTPGLLTCAHVVASEAGTLTFRPRRSGVDALVSINRANGLALLTSDDGHIDIGTWVNYIPLGR
jgi:molybdopterin molybdotransferase